MEHRDEIKTQPADNEGHEDAEIHRDSKSFQLKPKQEARDHHHHHTHSDFTSSASWPSQHHEPASTAALTSSLPINTGSITSMEKVYTSTEERDFTRMLYKFMEAKGQPITKIPSLGFRDLNLWKLYTLVTNRGGMDQVTKKQEWKSVYLDLGLSTMSTSASYNTRTNYKKYLYLYELEHFKPFEGSAKADYKYALKDYVKIESTLQGSVFYAQIIQRRVDEDGHNSYYLHYNNWSSSHDEWMPEAVLSVITSEEIGGKDPASLHNPPSTRSSKSNYLIYDSTDSTGSATAVSAKRHSLYKKKVRPPKAQRRAGGQLEDDRDDLLEVDDYDLPVHSDQGSTFPAATALRKTRPQRSITSSGYEEEDTEPEESGSLSTDSSGSRMRAKTAKRVAFDDTLDRVAKLLKVGQLYYSSDSDVEHHQRHDQSGQFSYHKVKRHHPNLDLLLSSATDSHFAENDELPGSEKEAINSILKLSDSEGSSLPGERTSLRIADAAAAPVEQKMAEENVAPIGSPKMAEIEALESIPDLGPTANEEIISNFTSATKELAAESQDFLASLKPPAVKGKDVEDVFYGSNNNDGTASKETDVQGMMNLLRWATPANSTKIGKSLLSMSTSSSPFSGLASVKSNSRGKRLLEIRDEYSSVLKFLNSERLERSSRDLLVEMANKGTSLDDDSTSPSASDSNVSDSGSSLLNSGPHINQVVL